MMSDSLKIVCWNGAITAYRHNIIPHHVEEGASLVLRVDMEDERPRVTLLKSRYAPSELCAEWQERSKPQVAAEVIELVQESIRQVRAAMDEVPLPRRTLNPCTVDHKALAELRLAVQAHNTCTEDLLAALEAGDARTPVPPEVLQRARELSGNDDSLRLRMPWENMAMERGDVIRDLLPHLRPEAERLTREEWAAVFEAIFDGCEGNTGLHLWRLEAMISAEIGNPDEGGLCRNAEPRDWWGLLTQLRDALAEAAKPPTPDFTSMTTDERRAWLRERGRLAVLDETDGSTWARLWERNIWGTPLIAEVNEANEPDALLALCEAVAVKERGNDE